MSERRIEWAVRELDPRNHGLTLPKNRAQAGDITPVASRDLAETVRDTREWLGHSPVEIVYRTVVVSDWETDPDTKPLPDVPASYHPDYRDDWKP